MCIRDSLKIIIREDAIYKESVSGDTIASHPVRQQLLADIETGKWEGVLVVEVERLARGDTIDQGIVAVSYTHLGRLDGKGGLSAKTVHDSVSVLVQIIRYGEGQHKIPAFQEERLILPKICLLYTSRCV